MADLARYTSPSLVGEGGADLNWHGKRVGLKGKAEGRLVRSNTQKGRSEMDFLFLLSSSQYSGGIHLLFRQDKARWIPDKKCRG